MASRLASAVVMGCKAGTGGGRGGGGLPHDFTQQPLSAGWSIDMVFKKPHIDCRFISNLSSLLTASAARQETT